MIVDPIRHLTDILALGGMFFFGFLFARMIAKLADSMARTERMAVERPSDEAAPQSAPLRANDNARDDGEQRLAA